MSLGLYYTNDLIPLFGGKGELFELAKIYFEIVMIGVPVLGLCMMSSNTLRAEGKPKSAMYAMFIPSISNLFLDYLFIYELGLGMYGAALATTLSYFICGIYILLFFILKKSDLKLSASDLKFDISIVKETLSLGFVTLSRQASVSLTVLVVNNILFSLQGENMIAVYAIISRMLMFMLFPILGITQGFIPIAGYNFGAKKKDRVFNSVKKAIIYSTCMATIIFLFIYTFSDVIANAFTSDVNIINKTSDALILVFMATPIIGIQLIGSAYFQAIGRALPALMLTLSRQVFFLIPLVFFLSEIYGVYGVWISFPLAELLSTILTGIYLNFELKKLIIRT
jgi:putative MATE family efflux protein